MGHLGHIPAAAMASRTIPVENLSSFKILFVLLANLAHGVLAQGTTAEPRIDYQDQIFILAGVFGGACVVLLLAVITPAYSFNTGYDRQGEPGLPSRPRPPGAGGHQGRQ